MSYTPGPPPEPDEHWMTDAHKYTAEQLSAHTAAEVARAVAAERERCAKVCEDEARKWEQDGTSQPMARLCAFAIRSAPKRLQGKGE